MGRHPTILHIRGGILRRIPARFSPDRSHPLNLNFFSAIFEPKKTQKCIFWEGFEKIFENRPGWPKIAPQGRLARWPAGRIFAFFLIVRKCPKKVPRAPRGPGAVFSAYFCLFLGPWGALGGPGAPYFPYLGLLLLLTTPATMAASQGSDTSIYN